MPDPSSNNWQNDPIVAVGKDVVAFHDWQNDPIVATGDQFDTPEALAQRNAQQQRMYSDLRMARDQAIYNAKNGIVDNPMLPRQDNNPPSPDFIPQPPDQMQREAIEQNAMAADQTRAAMDADLRPYQRQPEQTLGAALGSLPGKGAIASGVGSAMNSLVGLGVGVEARVGSAVGLLPPGLADDFNHQVSKYEATLPQDAQGRIIRGAASILTTAAVAGPVALGVFVGDTFNKALTEGRDAGLSEAGNVAQATAKAAIMAFTGKVFGRIGITGAEEAIPAATWREAAINVAKEYPTFASMGLADIVVNKTAGIDKTPWTPGQFGQNMLESAATLGVLGGVGGAKGQVLRYVSEDPVGAAKLMAKPGLSRADVKRIGFPGGTSEGMRAQIKDEIARQSEVLNRFGGQGAPEQSSEAEFQAQQNYPGVDNVSVLLETQPQKPAVVDGARMVPFPALPLESPRDKRIALREDVSHQILNTDLLDRLMPLGEKNNGAPPTASQISDHLSISLEQAREIRRQVFEGKGAEYAKGNGAGAIAPSEGQGPIQKGNGGLRVRNNEKIGVGSAALEKAAEVLGPNSSAGDRLYFFLRTRGTATKSANEKVVKYEKLLSSGDPDALNEFLKNNYAIRSWHDGELKTISSKWLDDRMAEARDEGVPIEPPEAAPPESAPPVREIRGGAPGPEKSVAAAEVAPKDNTVYMGSGGSLTEKEQGELKTAWQSVKDLVGGGLAPKTSRRDREAANALIRHAASGIGAEKIADSMIGKVIAGDNETALLTGAVLQEDNMRGLRKEKLDAGDTKGAEVVGSIVGEDGVFQDEAAYRKALNNPKVQAMIKRWKEIVNPWMDEQYRKLTGREPDAELASRGLETGARINMLADRGQIAKGTSGAFSNLMNPMRNRSVFARKATGTAEHYVTDPSEILKNTVRQTWGKVTRLDMYDALEKSGLAKYGARGENAPAETKGIEVTVPKHDAETNKTTYEKRMLYVNDSVYEEVRQALNVDERLKPNLIAKVLNKLQMIGPVDATAHTANVLSAIVSSPSGENILAEIGRKSPGVNVIDAIGKIVSAAIEIRRGDSATKARLERLAMEGVLRGSTHGGLSGKFIKILDESGRLALDKMYDKMVKSGAWPDTIEARRQFVGQPGNYNARLHGKTYNALKDSGLAPFLEAGVAFNRLGVKTLVGGYGGRAESKAADAKIRMVQLAGNIGTAVLASAAINQIVYGGAPNGVPTGSIYLGKKDANGKPLYLDLLKWNGVRRGLNVTGAGSIVEGLRHGRFDSKTIESAMRSAINSNLHPLIGPAAKFGVEAVAGIRPGAELGPSAPAAAPGESQIAANIKQAAWDTNPLVGGALSGISNVGQGGATKDKIGAGVGGALAGLANAAGIKRGTPVLSQAQELAREYLLKRVPAGPHTEDEQGIIDARRKLVDSVRSGKNPDEAIREALASGVTEKQAYLSSKKGRVDSQDAMFSQLSLRELGHVERVATPEEKSAMEPIIGDKIGAKAVIMSRPIPLKLKDRERWQADYSDAVESLNEFGATPEMILSAFKHHQFGQVKSQSTKTADRARLVQRLADIKQ